MRFRAMHIGRFRASAILVCGVLVIPGIASAQRGGMMRRGPGAGGNSVAPLIDMRRQLDLTGRQLAQLDSIERNLIRRNETVLGQLRARRDSLRQQSGAATSPEERAAFRARLDSLRPLTLEIRRNDSTAREAAMRVLNDSQRVRVRELQAERRGFERGRMMGGRRPGGVRSAPGMRGRMMPGAGPRGGRIRGGMGLQGFGGRVAPRGFGGRVGGPAIRDRLMPGPRFRMGPGPMGRGMRGGFAPPPDDSASIDLERRPFRRPMMLRPPSGERR